MTHHLGTSMRRNTGRTVAESVAPNFQVEPPERFSLETAGGASAVSSLPLAKLHPTQFTVGYREVAIKRQQWRDASIAERERLMQRRRVPVIIGPEGNFYIVDRHHWLRALADDGVECTEIVVMDDLQQLDAESFWSELEVRGHCHLFDTNGARRSAIELPTAIDHLEDDPFRSLAKAACRAIQPAPEPAQFNAFAWARDLRGVVPLELVKRDFDRAVWQALCVLQGCSALSNRSVRCSNGVNSRHCSPA